MQGGWVTIRIYRTQRRQNRQSGLLAAQHIFLTWARSEEDPNHPPLWRTHTGALSPPRVASLRSGLGGLYTARLKSVRQDFRFRIDR